MNEENYIEVNRISYNIVAEEYKTKYKNNIRPRADIVL